MQLNLIGLSDLSGKLDTWQAIVTKSVKSHTNSLVWAILVTTESCTPAEQTRDTKAPGFPKAPNLKSTKSRAWSNALNAPTRWDGMRSWIPDGSTTLRHDNFVSTKKTPFWGEWCATQQKQPNVNLDYNQFLCTIIFIQFYIMIYSYVHIVTYLFVVQNSALSPE
jgi:hypothetical protein